jgi:hypothetical protein
MSYCKVEYCRFPKTHITKYHSCGTCNQTGHGQVECGRADKIDTLRLFDNDYLDLTEQCTVHNCPDKTTHNISAHICLKCGRRHPEEECIIQLLDVSANTYNLDKSQIEDYFNHTINSNKFIKMYAGMGCQLFICLKNQNIMTLFMHHDSYGQYGSEADDTPILDNFIYNGLIDGTAEYNNLVDGGADAEDIKYIKCPICRKDIDVETVSPIFGSTDKCSVCLENNVEIYFPKCGHANTCKLCFEKLKV